MVVYLHKRYRHIWFAACVLCLFFISNAVDAQNDQRLRVGFLCAAPLDNPFWSQVIQVMQAAANDLNVELIVKCDATRSTYATKRLGNKLLETEPKIDYFLTKYWSAVTDSHMQIAKERGIKVFIFNSDVSPQDWETVGRKPRDRFDNWIGHMVPDDKQAAMELTRALVEVAISNGKIGADGRVHILGLSAPADTTVRVNREDGLKVQTESMSNAMLEELSSINWAAESALESTAGLLNTYPQTTAIWAANEAIAWGAVKAVEVAGKKPGKDIFVGGFDWNPESIKAIEDGRMTASMFGHFLEGAWALLLCHDYHYGYDFKNDLGVRISTPLGIINSDNYNRYKAVLNESHWEQVDFRKLSKKYNPELKSYNFNINQFLK